MSKFNLITLLILINLDLLPVEQSLAQLQLSSFIDIGKTNVSEGTYITSSAIAAYDFGKIEVTVGSQLNIIQSDKQALGSIYLGATHDLKITNFSIKVKGFFMHNPFSRVAKESNFGLATELERSHFIFQLGTNFRYFYISDKAAETYNIESNKSILERWNLMYAIKYRFKPEDHSWNIGAAITNIDHFLINQETNPMISLNGNYRLSQSLELFAETWYKGAGSLNISASHFGYFFRTGLVWKLS